VEIKYTMENNQQSATGAVVHYKKLKSTRYVIRNNSTDRAVNKFYIDHTADSSHGGFVIITKEKCVKSVTGWSRYQMSINPQEEVEFIVSEEASYENVLSVPSFDSFIEKTAPNLLAEKILTNNTLEKMKQMWQSKQLSSALEHIQSESWTERGVQQWRELGVVDEALLKNLDIILTNQARIVQVTSQTKILNDHINKVFQNQQRLRENLKSLEKVSSSTLVDRYLKDLNAEEDDLIQSRKSIDALEEEKAKLETGVKNMKASMSSEASKRLKKMAN